MSRHGDERAALTVALRADALLDQGDMEGFNAWKRIVKAINELERVRPAAGEALNEQAKFTQLAIAVNLPHISQVSRGASLGYVRIAAVRTPH